MDDIVPFKSIFPIASSKISSYGESIASRIVSRMAACKSSSLVQRNNPEALAQAIPKVVDAGMTGNPERIHAWRRARRQQLLVRRLALSKRQQTKNTLRILHLLTTQGPELAGGRLGFYWPMQGEVDIRSYVRGALPKLETAALPIIIDKQSRMEFWRWDSRTKLFKRGLWNIPSPERRVLVEPTILLVPLLGFDERGYRLGYGGEHYDRFLSELTSRPFTIGIGYELGRVETIPPQPDDVPMQMIVTEAGIRTFFSNS